MRDRGYAHRIDVRATPLLLWRALTEPALLALWYGPGARVDARTGGSYRLPPEGGPEREAHIDVFEPPRRLRLIYMPRASMPADDAVIVDDFLLDATGEVGVLRVLGSGIPEGRAWDAVYLQLRDGWERALLRLKQGIERQTIGTR